MILFPFVYLNISFLVVSGVFGTYAQVVILLSLNCGCINVCT